MNPTGVFSAKLLINNPQDLLSVLRLVELRSELHHVTSAEGLNLHADEVLPDLARHVINDQNHITVF